jgi:hypothetical protein
MKKKVGVYCVPKEDVTYLLQNLYTGEKVKVKFVKGNFYRCGGNESMICVTRDKDQSVLLDREAFDSRFWGGFSENDVKAFKKFCKLGMV